MYGHDGLRFRMIFKYIRSWPWSDPVEARYRLCQEIFGALQACQQFYRKDQQVKLNSSPTMNH